jgi:glutathione S-transferase
MSHFESLPTLHYFAGRGLADQVRWLLAASGIKFRQVVVDTHDKFRGMVDSKVLMFGQMPLLQIDGINIVQSQAIVRYIARRENLVGSSPQVSANKFSLFLKQMITSENKYTLKQETVKCDMIAECIRDVLGLLTGCPFQRRNGGGEAHISMMKEKWVTSFGPKFESLLASNGGEYFVGSSMTYPDVLITHVITWMVEEIGDECMNGHFPNLQRLQQRIKAIPSIVEFVASDLWYPIGDSVYCQQVEVVLGRDIK